MEDPREGKGPPAALRALPSVDRVAAALLEEEPAAVATEAARRAVDLARQEARAGTAVPSFDEVVKRASELLAARRLTLLDPVLNGTGVIIHTNLGRAPLGPRQLDAVRRVGGYTTLELDLATGTRGDRYRHVEAALRELTGAEAALVVNNNAAAVLLTLAALCKGRRVIVSRGELVEIGGEFRIPEVMEWSGATLVEVGTTNRTHLADYERAIEHDTAAILKVHPSNYRIVGFTSQVPAPALASLARDRGIHLVNDIGSGLLRKAPEAPWLSGEPTVEGALAEGADVVTFSGDKLLGGPQAGVITGRAELVAKLKRHPLLRTLRVDKMTIAALQATLELYLEDRAAELPLWQMAGQTEQELEARATAMVTAWKREATLEAVPLEAVAGGGSLPEQPLPSYGLAVTRRGHSAAEVQRALRAGRPPVLVRVERNRVLLDLRTIPPDRDADLMRAIEGALG